MMLILLLFLLFRVFDFLTALLAPKFIPYLGHFSHPKVLKIFNLPYNFESFANFDGIFYLRIATQGYEQFEQAFFPLYPFLINIFSWIWNSPLVVGLVISNLSFLTALFVFKKYLDLVLKDKKHVFWTITFMVVFPTSFFFGSLYTESLFFLFTVSFFYFLKKERFLGADGFGFFAALTRFIGVFLIIPALIYFFTVKRRGKSKLYLPMVLAPLLGIGTYSYYLWKFYGDVFLFFSSQTAFSAGRSTKLILPPQVYYRYLKIFLTASKNFQYFVSVLEFSLFTLVLLGVLWFGYKVWREKNWDLTALSVFSLLNILVPTLTGTFLSTPRFALISLSFFVFLSQIKNRNLKLGIALIFILLHTVLLAYFIQGYFVS